LLYGTDFSDPPFVGGANTWAGTDGWESTNTTDGVQGIMGSGNQFAYLGLNATSDANIFIWQPFNYDPVAQGNPWVNITAQIAVIDSTTGNRDRFGIEVYNDSIQLLGAVYFDNTNQGIYRNDGSVSSYTGSNFVNGLVCDLSLDIDFQANTWSVRLDSTALFLNQIFNGAGADLNLCEIDFIDLVSNPGTPGDNFLQIDNLSVSAIPEPGTYVLLGMGLLCLIISRRTRPASADSSNGRAKLCLSRDFFQLATGYLEPLSR
jgi:hypothetical protein